MPAITSPKDREGVQLHVHKRVEVPCQQEPQCHRGPQSCQAHEDALCGEAMCVLALSVFAAFIDLQEILRVNPHNLEGKVETHNQYQNKLKINHAFMTIIMHVPKKCSR